jgi:hypothetical protein
MNTNIEKEASQLLAQRDEKNRPVWVRGPKGGEVEHYSGLGRGKLYQLEKDGLIRTASLKPRGAVRGVKLFLLQGLLDYIDKCSSQLPEKINSGGEGE